MVIFITLSPITNLVFDSYNDNNQVYEIHDEDDSKDKVLFTFNEEMKDQKLHFSQPQLSAIFKIFLNDFSPEVPFPPPKII